MTEENQNSTSNRRVDERLPVMWRGRITTEDGSVHECEICDISTAGTLINCEVKLPTGTDILLEIDDLGEFAGRVRWASSPQLGLILMAGPDLALKRFAQVSPEKPVDPDTEA